MVKNTQGVGYFTAENIVAVLKAVPQTDGTYANVTKRTRDYHSEISKHLLGKWVSTGRRDLKSGRREIAYARFDDHSDRLKREHCAADARRQRDCERALQILERTCECGNEKITMPDGSLGDSCRERQEIEGQARPRRTRRT